MKKTKYINLLANESGKSQNWMLMSFFLMGFCVFLGYLLKTTINEMPVKLVPYDFHKNKGVIETTKNGTDNQTYIQLIARSDIDLLTQFSPQNSVKRSKQLVNRFTPELAVNTKASLQDQAEQNKEDQITQSFLVQTLKSRDGREVLVSGHLRRWEGEELISDSLIKFAISYEYIDDIPLIINFTPFEEEETITRKLNEINKVGVK
ncbi:TraE/TraK family type IV conjugative transfer system protein [Pseudoalteromonas marina]|uniref:TraE/TraK family type IV conjugative transfer system protein n=1 Tax=Pseudoalteromonas marina TaxID=267375 RepID=A0ABT9FC57_9GAMM|nr:TraE/TraK family type IV conjugative transfer system protein [Pseudoalteromonas marina]MDP2564376.1 TraE/TraK family type IV conjugative transfer system protein [Pseudoalteromonas marina]